MEIFWIIFIFVENKIMANPNTQYLIEWCHENNIMIKPNSEVFFVNERALIRPEYVIKNNIFVDLLNQSEITERYLQICREFSGSFGSIILIPFESLPGIKNITKEMFEQRYNVHL
jgi:hypothetical protein